MERLIFVYNAFSGLHNGVLDSMHKFFSPGTYTCDLCRITHGVFSEKSDWKKFRKESKLEMEFLHLDEFRKQYASKFGYKYDFPVVLRSNGENLEILVASEEVAEIDSVTRLINVIKERV